MPPYFYAAAALPVLLGILGYSRAQRVHAATGRSPFNLSPVIWALLCALVVGHLALFATPKKAAADVGAPAAPDAETPRDKRALRAESKAAKKAEATAAAAAKAEAAAEAKAAKVAAKYAKRGKPATGGDAEPDDESPSLSTATADVSGDAPKRATRGHRRGRRKRAAEVTTETTETTETTDVATATPVYVQQDGWLTTVDEVVHAVPYDEEPAHAPVDLFPTAQSADLFPSAPADLFPSAPPAEPADLFQAPVAHIPEQGGASPYEAPEFAMAAQVPQAPPQQAAAPVSQEIGRPMSQEIPTTSHFAELNTEPAPAPAPPAPVLPEEPIGPYTYGARTIVPGKR